MPSHTCAFYQQLGFVAEGEGLPPDGILHTRCMPAQADSSRKVTGPLLHQVDQRRRRTPCGHVLVALAQRRQ